MTSEKWNQQKIRTLITTAAIMRRSRMGWERGGRSRLAVREREVSLGPNYTPPPPPLSLQIKMQFPFLRAAPRRAAPGGRGDDECPSAFLAADWQIGLPPPGARRRACVRPVVSIVLTTSSLPTSASHTHSLTSSSSLQSDGRLE